MARYFFNIFDGEDIFDETGTELDNIDDVRLYMVTIAKMWIERKEHQYAHWSLEARDENEKLVGSMRFGVTPEKGD